LKVDIQKKYYQKTHLAEDGITHITDNQNHTMYYLEICENYFIEDKTKAVEKMIKDLETLTNEMKIELDKHTKGKEERK
jgi:hypothetical protein